MLRVPRPILALATVAAAISAGVSARAQVNWIQNQVNWSTLRTGIVCNVPQQSVQVIASQNDFQAYWRNAMGQSPDSIPKSIDWAKDKLVAVHLGQRKSGGYTVEVRNIQKSGSVATLRVIEHTPMDGQWVSQSVTSPFVIVRIPRDISAVRQTFEQIKGFPVPGVQISGATTYIRPGYDKPGGGSVDPNNHTDWGTVFSGNCALPATAGVYALNGALEWNDFFARATGSPTSLGAPSVDWSRYRLVVVHLGERQSTRFRVIVNTVETNGSIGVIRAVEEMPVAGSWVRERATYPYVVIRVPRGMTGFRLDLEKREGNGTVTHVGG